MVGLDGQAAMPLSSEVTPAPRVGFNLPAEATAGQAVMPLSSVADTPKMTAKHRRSLKKKKKQAINKNRKNKFMRIWNRYLEILREGGWPIPNKGDPPTEINPPSHLRGKPPSYSMMHSLEEGMSIIMYSCTYNAPAVPFSIHCDQGIRLLLPPDCTLFWHQATLHCGARSRINSIGQHKDDMRLFAYIWTDGSVRISN